MKDLLWWLFVVALAIWTLAGVRVRWQYRRRHCSKLRQRIRNAWWEC